MDKKLTIQDFEEKQLAEQKGELWKYYEYREDNKVIVLRFYSIAIAVDYYVGMDLEDSQDETIISKGTEIQQALDLANKFFTKYEFKGKENA